MQEDEPCRVRAQQESSVLRSMHDSSRELRRRRIYPITTEDDRDIFRWKGGGDDDIRGDRRVRVSLRAVCAHHQRVLTFTLLAYFFS